MNLRVNGREIDEAEIEAEARHHDDADDPLQAAATALVLRRLIVDRARSRGLLNREQLEPADADLDDALEALLALELELPEPDEHELRRFYEQNRERLRTGEAVRAAHILFAVTRPDLAEPLREKAGEVLAQCGDDPAAFADAAQRLSNCPSGADRGDLGWLHRGECVPEFERIVFSARTPGLWPRPVPTRFGWHLVRVLDRAPGREPSFEEARASVAAHLKERNRRKAGAQYLRRLVAEAEVEGLELPAVDGWLMQ